MMAQHEQAEQTDVRDAVAAMTAVMARLAAGRRR